MQDGTYSFDYCDLSFNGCLPEANDVRTQYFQEAQADEWGSTNVLPWLTKED